MTDNMIVPSHSARCEYREYIKEKYPELEWSIIGKSLLGEELDAFRIGRGERMILSVGAHHAMEHISTAALWRVIDKMAEKLTRGGIYSGLDVAYIFAKYSFWFVPCLNPDGIDLLLGHSSGNPIYGRALRMNGSADFSKWQANARGVDLNHNYDYGFADYKLLEEKHGIEAGATRYSGEYPESEPETRALSSFIRCLAPSLIFSFHTQGEELYYRPRNDSYTKKLAGRVGKKLAYAVSVPEGLADYGGLCDYTGELLSIPSLTVELGKGENPISPSQLPFISEKLIRLFMTLPTIM